MELPPDVKKLISEYQRWYASIQPKEGVPAIEVDEVAAKVASFYEKIRGVVDWREEHLLRKTAIERILKRRMLLRGEEEEFAQPFLQELIRGGHFPNGRIPVAQIEVVQKIVDKYTYLLDNSPSEGSEKFLAELRMWLLSIAAAEIEETLAPPIKERGLIAFMTEDMMQRVALGNGKPFPEEEKRTQLSVAVQRALFKLDEQTITYHLLEQLYPNWKALDGQELDSIAKRLPEVQRELHAILHHSLAERLYQLMEKYDTPYLIIGDVLTENPNLFEEQGSEPAQLESVITEAYQIRYRRLRERMKRAAIYSTLSVFLSKVLIALGIEIPFDKYVTGDFSQTTVALSVVVPSLFMLLLVMSTKSTSQENFQRVLMEIMKIVYGTRKEETLEVPLLRRRRPVLEMFVNGIYLLSFLFSFGVISWILLKLNFSIPSVIVFLLFLSLVAFAGTKIRQRGRELMLGEEKQGFLYTIFDLFALPVIQTGKWLSKQVVRYNILIVIFNFLIEIPFQVFVEFLEHWRSFLRKKREEVH